MGARECPASRNCELHNVDSCICYLKGLLITPNFLILEVHVASRIKHIIRQNSGHSSMSSGQLHDEVDLKSTKACDQAQDRL